MPAPLIAGAAIIGGASAIGASKSAKAQRAGAQAGADASVHATKIAAAADKENLRKTIEYQKEAQDRSLNFLRSESRRAEKLAKPFQEQQIAQGKLTIASIERYQQSSFEALGKLQSEAEDLKLRAEDPESDAISRFERTQLNKSLSARGLTNSGQEIMEETGIFAREAQRREGLLADRRSLLLQLGGFGAGVQGRGIGSSQQAGIAAGAAGQGASIIQQGGLFGAGAMQQSGLTQTSMTLGAGQARADAARSIGQIKGSFYQGLGNLPGNMVAFNTSNPGALKGIGSYLGF